MLRACRRTLVERGRTAFTTIVVAPGLGKRAHRRAVWLGPRAVASRRPLADDLHAAGFDDVTIDDVTPDFLVTVRAWQDEFARHERALRDALGAEFDERRRERAHVAAGIEEGLLLRVLASGTARPRS